MKRVFLYFGSFNPLHNGHLALAEHVLDRGLCDSVIFIVSPQNPLKDAGDLLPELARFEMVEEACHESKYPEAIQPSAIEFLLDRPSYTIDTLRYLTANHGSQMRFSLLVGADIIDELERWKDYEAILDNYDVHVYPRRGYSADRYADRITYLADAPEFDFSSTEIRHRALRGESVEGLVPPAVARYMATHALLRPTVPHQCPQPECSSTAQSDRNVARQDNGVNSDNGEDDVEKLLERGRNHYRHSEWGSALNDFNAVLRLDPDNREAREFARMVGDILEFRYKDIYNP